MEEVVTGPKPQSGRERDRPWFDEIFERHSSRVYNYAIRRTGSAPEAEDLAASAFLLAWRERDRLQNMDEGRLLAWILVTTSNLVKTSHRAKSRARALFRRLASDRPLPAPAGPETDLLQMERVLAARALLDRLPERDRQIISLCVMEGLPASEVADLLGRNQSTVRSQLERALGRLRAAARVADATSMELEN